MDKIWDRKLAVVVGMKKPNDHAEPTKRRTLKKIITSHLYTSFTHQYTRITYIRNILMI